MVAAPGSLERRALPLFFGAILLVLGSTALARSGHMPLPAEDQNLVNQAIDLGVDYLRGNQTESGSWAKEDGSHKVGYAALPGLTLLECGFSAKEPEVKKAAAYVRRNCAKLDGTYEVALAILFLDRLGDARDRKLIQTLALRLIAGQSPTGGWSYRCPVLTAAQHSDLWTVLHFKKKQLKLSAIPANLRRLPVLQDPATLSLQDPADKLQEPIWGTTDNSNTQFAILGVWASRRHQVPVERTLTLVVQRFHTSQNGDGSWGYRYNRGGGVAEGPPMNCVGLLGLALGQRVADKGAKTRPVFLYAFQAAAGVVAPSAGPRLPAAVVANKVWAALHKEPDKAPQEPKILNGFVALNKHLGQPTGSMRNLPMPNLYFLWSVERAAVLFGLKTLGDKDWYRWGAELLVANQKPDGHWEGSSYPGSTATIDTCLALLFLKRANLAKDLSAGLRVNAKNLSKQIVNKAPPVAVVVNKSPAKDPDPVPPKSADPVKPTVANKPPAPAPKAPPPAPPAKEESGGGKWVLIFSGLGLLLALGGAVFLFMNRRERPETEATSRKSKKSSAKTSKDEDEPERPRGKDKGKRKGPAHSAED